MEALGREGERRGMVGGWVSLSLFCVVGAG